MSFQHVGWAFRLHGRSPAAKLLAICCADSGVDPDSNVALVPIRHLLDWTNLDYEAALQVFAELRDAGVSWRDTGHGEFEVHFPDQLSATVKRGDAEPTEIRIAIYVISAGPATKIGISREPTNRLQNLQSANPGTKPIKHFEAWGPASKIREAERTAHALLTDVALGREWFQATPAECIAAVTLVLERLGIK